MNSPCVPFRNAEPRESIGAATGRVFWANGRIWITCNPDPHRRRRRVPLVHSYEETSPLAPDPETIERIVAELVASIPREERFEFDVQATILRAAARESHA